MPRENYQKIKLLLMLELLRAETDEQHPMRTSQICNRLAQQNVPCDRRTLTKDIALMNEMGFEVMSTWVDREKGYYIEERGFSVPELKILIDAVQAASFITKPKTAELTDKLSRLGGTHRAELLKKNLVCFNTRKHSNESIYYSVLYLEEALEKRQMVSFFYYDLDEHKEKVYRKDKKRYIVEPVSLVYIDDNYYLMCYSSKYGNISNYRVDRMENVSIEEETVSENAVIYAKDVGDYTEQVFRMYSGTIEECVLQFDSSLIGVVYDKFGEDTLMRRSDEDTLVATVKVQISPTFWGWIFQFGNKMRILSPQKVVEEYKERVMKLIEW